VERLKETLNNTTRALFLSFRFNLAIVFTMMITFLTFALKSDVNAFSLFREEQEKMIKLYFLIDSHDKQL
jgi:hypothetical protein